MCSVPRCATPSVRPCNRPAYRPSRDAVETGAGPEEQALHGELSAQLRALLDELPEKQREVLVLRIVVGLSAEETAEAVGARPDAVRVAEARAADMEAPRTPRLQ